ncbi:MAG TPA: hypothetical protein VGK67_27870 [Myxococcales bacterium]|jgi:hypothetical protein
MNRSQSSGFWGTAAASAVAGALMVLVVFGARPTNAGLPQKKHAALAKDVTVDGMLTKEGDGWVIAIKAANSGSTEQRCELGTHLTSVRNSMMSRVPAMPKVVWQSTLAVTVPAGGQADQKLQVPDELAKRIAAAQVKPKKEEMFEARESFGVRIQASCEKRPADEVS